MSYFLPLIPLGPGLAAGILALLGKRAGLRTSGAIAILFSVVSFGLAVYLVIPILMAGSSLTFSGWTFLPLLPDADARFAFRLDVLSGLMCLLITFFGTLILVFSCDYMHDDDSPGRYFASMSLFLSAMLILVLSENLFLLFLGWEGVGLCSYLLIGHYWKEEGVPVAAYRAFFVNRIGDLFFLMGVFVLLRVLGTASFTEMADKFAALKQGAELSPNVKFDLQLAGFLLLGGAFGKSAQVPLHVWLPDAMAGPTPVSALIHAATMVTAGVFLLVRLEWLYTGLPNVRMLILICGLATLILGAVLAIFQNDIKKVLAYSTLSHLGLMFTAVAASSSGAAMLHLFGHASFKAISFLAAGSVILASHHEQDLRNLRGILKRLPVTRVAIWIGAIGGAGIVPFLSAGFFSKEGVLHSLTSHNLNGVGIAIPADIVYWIVFCTEILGCVYLFRMLALLESESQNPQNVSAANEAHPIQHGTEGGFLRFVLIVLIILAPLFGVISSPFVHGLQSILFKEAMHLAIADMILPVVVSLLASAIAFVAFRKSGPEKIVEGIAESAPIKKNFFFDSLYEVAILKPLRLCGQLSSDMIEYFGFAGLMVFAENRSMGVGARLAKYQSGLINRYALVMVVCGMIILLCSVLM